MHGIKVLARKYNGKEAIDLFVQHNPLFIIIDLSLPDFDGFFAIEGIQKINKGSQILVLTGDTNQETKKKLDNLGISKLIYKPCEISALLKFFEIKYNFSGQTC
jgi:DNA-binding NarL/FixJ family response regulator